MSLGGSGYSQAEYNAIQGAVNKGVAFAVAAGNNDADANNYSPAAFDNVLTVERARRLRRQVWRLAGYTCRIDQDDTLADFSNWGPAVDIAAPGVCITSTYPIEQGSYGTISGTSMASPHAAGALALLASKNNPGNATHVNLYDQVRTSGNFLDRRLRRRHPGTAARRVDVYSQDGHRWCAPGDCDPDAVVEVQRKDVDCHRDFDGHRFRYLDVHRGQRQCPTARSPPVLARAR